MSKPSWLGHICVELINDLKSKIVDYDHFNMLETGTIRDLEPYPGEPKDARSTLAIAKAMTDVDWLDSLDLSFKHIEIARQVLKTEGLENKKIYFHQGYSHVVLDFLKEKFPMKYDFVLLDSDSDPKVIWQEYVRVVDMLAENAIVVIDDVKKSCADKGAKVLAQEKRPWKMVGQYIAAIPFGPLAEEVVNRHVW